MESEANVLHWVRQRRTQVNPEAARRSVFKPGRSYQPIALINKICKTLTAIVTRQITSILEKYFYQRTTSEEDQDARLQTRAPHDAWYSKKVASARPIPRHRMIFPQCSNQAIDTQHEKVKTPTRTSGFHGTHAN